MLNMHGVSLDFAFPSLSRVNEGLLLVTLQARHRLARALQGRGGESETGAESHRRSRRHWRQGVEIRAEENAVLSAAPAE